MSELICAGALETQAKWEQEPEFLRADKLQVVINFNICGGVHHYLFTAITVTNLLFYRTQKMIFWQMDHSHNMFQSDLFSTEWKQRQWEGKNLALFKR